jgi:putative DNA primase/helicase
VKKKSNGVPSPGTPHDTDLGNAKRLVQAHGDDMRYVPNLGWLVWDGVRWCRDATGEVVRRAKRTIRDLYREAQATDDEHRRPVLVVHALRSESVSRLRAMVTLAESEGRVVSTVDDFDAKPWLLNLNNGTLDLKSGKLREHRRGDRLTQCAPVEHDAEATCPQWLAFLSRTTGDDQELVAYLQRIIGYALTGLTTEQCFFVLYGIGANGKSTFLVTLQAMLGEYAKQAAPDLFTIREGEQHPTGMADLRGSRMVVCTETERGKRLAESLVKQMTGGDRVKARFMRQDFFEFTPTHKIFLATNHKPKVLGSDHGIWRRVRLIPFEVTIPSHKQNKHLVEELTKELPGILNWAVEGCLQWQSHGLVPPRVVDHATKGYQAEMDVLSGFLATCCVVSPLAHVTAKDLHGAYTSWASKTDMRVLSQRALGLALGERGFRNERADHSNPTIWRGLGLKKKGKLHAA